LEEIDHPIRVEFGGEVIAETSRARRVLETSHPPVYYIPAEDVRKEYLRASAGSSFCEWKGRAVYHSLEVNGRVARDAAWSYPEPTARFAAIRDCLAFYASRVDACFVDGERVTAQPGDFYGGWVTSKVVGPFKGTPGTSGW
jgi:uncharacterized protein (DUF427 family)